MNNKLVTAVIAASVFASSCRKLPGTCSIVKSGHNKVSCKVDYSRLMQDRLNGIRIVDIGISPSEKIRHLNELNMMPKEFLNVMRGRVTVNLTDGGITNLPSYERLKGVTPRGWPAGSTWDMIPGIGSTSSLALGDSALKNNAWSLAIHEATHSVDFQTKFTNTREFQEAFNADRGRPHPKDSNGTYRTSYPAEYLAIAVDEYYCSPQTKDRLKQQYPKAYALIDQHFTRLLVASGKQTEPVGGGATTPKPQPIPVPKPTPKPTSQPMNKPTQEPNPDPNPNPGNRDDVPMQGSGGTPTSEPNPRETDPTPMTSGSAKGSSKEPTINESADEDPRPDAVFHPRFVPKDPWCG